MERFLRLLGLIAIALAGCGTGNTPQLGAVTGFVTLDGAPVPDAVVSFQPNQGRGARARTAEDGGYELHYIAGAKGALLGVHRVTISTQSLDEDPVTHKTIHRPEILPARYNAETELSRTVEAGPNEFNFELTSK